MQFLKVFVQICAKIGQHGIARKYILSGAGACNVSRRGPLLCSISRVPARAEHRALWMRFRRTEGEPMRFVKTLQHHSISQHYTPQTHHMEVEKP